MARPAATITALIALVLASAAPAAASSGPSAPGWAAARVANPAAESQNAREWPLTAISQRTQVAIDDFGREEIRDVGGAVVAASPSGLEYGFQGRRRDQETGWVYFRARFYDSETGRFLSRDPVWDATNLGGWYTFVANGPVSALDPTGLVGTGHHVVPQELWETFEVSDAARKVFDSDQARIFHEYYTWHSGRSQFGISHIKYNAAVGEELKAFECQTGKKAAAWTADMAKEFLELVLGKGTDTRIGKFLLGIRIERDIAIQLAIKGIQKGGKKPANLAAMVGAYVKKGGSKTIVIGILIGAFSVGMAQSAQAAEPGTHSYASQAQAQEAAREVYLDYAWDLLSPVFVDRHEAAEIFDTATSGALSIFLGASKPGGVLYELSRAMENSMSDR